MSDKHPAAATRDSVAPPDSRATSEHPAVPAAHANFSELGQMTSDLASRSDEAQRAYDQLRAVSSGITGVPHDTSATEAADIATKAPDSVSPDTARAQTQLSTVGVKKSYRKGQHEIRVLDGVDLQVHPGEFLAIVGQSGSGKSTLLHLLGTLDVPDAGEVYLGDKRIDNLPSRGQEMLRNDYFGMIFQFYHLLPELSALENVLAPMMIRHGIFAYWAGARKFKKRARQLLDSVGLGHRVKHKPREMSGGEMQRAAIARALITDPQVLLADEPTGNLDHETGEEIMSILRTLNREQGLTIIMVTHDDSIARQADRIVRLVDGRVEKVERRSSQDRATVESM